VDIDIPQLNEFIHKVYVHCARKLYTNVYLFERGIPPLTTQKNMRETELIIKECILDSIRESIPLEMILRTYMDETIEDHTEIKIKEEIVSQEPVVDESQNQNQSQNQSQSQSQSQSQNQSQSQTVSNDAAVIAAGFDPVSDAFPSVPSSSSDISAASAASAASTASAASIKFNDMDRAIDMNNAEHSIHAPKTDERLEQISNERYMQRKLQEEDDNADDDELDRIKIGEDVQLDVFDVHPMEEPSRRLNFDAPDLDDIEILA
jgi:hypothetical protein